MPEEPGKQSLREAEAVRRLLEAGMSYRNIQLFFSLSVRDAYYRAVAHLIIDPHCKNGRGRPKEVYEALTGAQKLAVLDLMYGGHDIIEITNKSGLNIDSICEFLFDSDMAFGYRHCCLSSCGKSFVYIDNEPMYCNDCAKERKQENIVPRTLNVSYKLQKLPACRKSEEYRSFNKQLGLAHKEKVLVASEPHFFGRGAADNVVRMVDAIEQSVRTGVPLVDPSRFIEPFLAYIHNMKKAIDRLDALTGDKKADQGAGSSAHKGAPIGRKNKQRNLRINA
jgi:hypothetical protein